MTFEGPNASISGRDDWLAALLIDEIMQAVGVVGAISEHFVGWDAPDEIASGSHVVLLPGAEEEADRQSQRIDYAWTLVPNPLSLGREPGLERAPFLPVPGGLSLSADHSGIDRQPLYVGIIRHMG